MCSKVEDLAFLSRLNSTTDLIMWDWFISERHIFDMHVLCVYWTFSEASRPGSYGQLCLEQIFGLLFSDLASVASKGF